MNVVFHDAVSTAAKSVQLAAGPVARVLVSSASGNTQPVVARNHATRRRVTLAPGDHAWLYVSSFSDVSLYANGSKQRAYVGGLV